MNTRFVNETNDLQDTPLPWWQHPWAREALRLGLGALVLLALMFGILRPALRQLTGHTDKHKSTDEQNSTVSELELNADLALAEDALELSEDAEQAAIAPPVQDPYEERLQLAREAVRADSARVAQVVKGWIGEED